MLTCWSPITKKESVVAKLKRKLKSAKKPRKVNVNYWVEKAKGLGFPVAVLHNCTTCAQKRPDTFTVENEIELRNFLACPLFNIKLLKPEAA